MQVQPIVARGLAVLTSCEDSRSCVDETWTTWTQRIVSVFSVRPAYGHEQPVSTSICKQDSR